MKHLSRSLSLRTLRPFVSLALLLIASISLGACGTFGKTQFVAQPIKLVDIPVDVKRCLAERVRLPRGDWTVQQVADIVAAYQRREGQLEGCILDVVDFYKSYQRRLARTGR